MVQGNSLSCVQIFRLESYQINYFSFVLFSGFKYGRVGLGMLGKFATTVYFNSFYLWSAELNATVVR